MSWNFIEGDIKLDIDGITSIKKFSFRRLSESITIKEFLEGFDGVNLDGMEVKCFFGKKHSYYRTREYDAWKVLDLSRPAADYLCNQVSSCDIYYIMPGNFIKILATNRCNVAGSFKIYTSEETNGEINLYIKKGELLKNSVETLVKGIQSNHAKDNTQGPLVVAVGPNRCGKTQLCYALEAHAKYRWILEGEVKYPSEENSPIACVLHFTFPGNDQVERARSRAWKWKKKSASDCSFDFFYHLEDDYDEFQKMNEPNSPNSDNRDPVITLEFLEDNVDVKLKSVGMVVYLLEQRKNRVVWGNQWGVYSRDPIFPQTANVLPCSIAEGRQKIKQLFGENDIVVVCLDNYSFETSHSSVTILQSLGCAVVLLTEYAGVIKRNTVREYSGKWADLICSFPSIDPRCFNLGSSLLFNSTEELDKIWQECPQFKCLQRWVQETKFLPTFRPQILDNFLWNLAYSIRKKNMTQISSILNYSLCNATCKYEGIQYADGVLGFFFSAFSNQKLKEFGFPENIPYQVASQHCPQLKVPGNMNEINGLKMIPIDDDLQLYKEGNDSNHTENCCHYLAFPDFHENDLAYLILSKNVRLFQLHCTMVRVINPAAHTDNDILYEAFEYSSSGKNSITVRLLTELAVLELEKSGVDKKLLRQVDKITPACLGAVMKAAGEDGVTGIKLTHFLEFLIVEANLFDFTAKLSESAIANLGPLGEYWVPFIPPVLGATFSKTFSVLPGVYSGRLVEDGPSAAYIIPDCVNHFELEPSPKLAKTDEIEINKELTRNSQDIAVNSNTGLFLSMSLPSETELMDSITYARTLHTQYFVEESNLKQHVHIMFIQNSKTFIELATKMKLQTRILVAEFDEKSQDENPKMFDFQSVGTSDEHFGIVVIAIPLDIVMVANS